MTSAHTPNKALTLSPTACSLCVAGLPVSFDILAPAQGLMVLNSIPKAMHELTHCIPNRDDHCPMMVTAVYPSGTALTLTDTFSDPTVQAATADHSGQPQSDSQSGQRKVWLLEGGYTSDTGHLEKLQEKRQQHTTLSKALEPQGFDAQLLIPTFGVDVTIYKKTQDYSTDAGGRPVEMQKASEGRPFAFCGISAQHCRSKMPS